MVLSSKMIIVSIYLALVSAVLAQPVCAQAKKDFFQSGEQLTYNVRYGLITLGTVDIQTGAILPNGNVQARMLFWTANIPFLSARMSITDQIATSDCTIRTFEEHSQNGSRKTDEYRSYDPNTKTLTFSDDSVTDKITHDIAPFDDGIGVFFDMRAWSGATGHSYIFHVRDKAGAKPVTLTFTKQIVNQSVPALDNREIPTRVVKGMMDMGHSAPLGADGAFTAYVSNDEAAIPLRIDMSIAIGSISLILERVRRTEWTAAQ